MADSDNNTSRSVVTRRTLLAGTMAGTAKWLLEPELATGLPTSHISPDPALALWREWQAAHYRTEQLCRKQQRLEMRLAKSVGFPCTIVSLPQEKHVKIFSVDGLDELFGQEACTPAVRDRAYAEFAIHQARWNAADTELGYSTTLWAERESANEAQKLADALSATRATSLAGVAGKLNAVIRGGETGGDCSEFPWPQIRSALSDLVRLGEQTMPGQFIPGDTRRRLASKRLASRQRTRSRL